MENNGFVYIGDKEYYKISNYDEMEAFLFTLASSNDLWIHLSSNQGITAGRCNTSGAIFPYVSEDKLHKSTDSGAKTLIRVTKNDKTCLWQPFVKSYIKQYRTQRNIYKSVMGNAVIFEEINKSLGMSFKYKWQCCDEYGIIRDVCLENLNDFEVSVEVVDGLVNILPYGIKPVLQANWSCLGDAYKKNELMSGSGIGIFALTGAIVDVPSPEEMLRANTVWSMSDFDREIFITEKALDLFADNCALPKEKIYCGERGAYLIHFNAQIKSCSDVEWSIIADVGYDQIQLSELDKKIRNGEIDKKCIQKALDCSEESLREIIAKADGLQCTGNKMASVHHMSNVTFNNMRGGLFLNGYEFDYKDFMAFVAVRNKEILKKHKDFFENPVSDVYELKEQAQKTGDKDLIRLCFEYLPVSFSRRHGDPSRPWNDFSIVLKNPDGTPVTNYEGNWRDIFQNWEAMCLSFPWYIDSVIAKFLNASTADGFNPSKVSSAGIEWEKFNPDDPCPSMGYWGDHQIIYLTRLLEWLLKFNKKGLCYLIESDMFTYANVPYEIVCFDELMKDPEHTIKHNMEKDKNIIKLSDELGTDYRLLVKDGEIYHAAFVEKLIVPILSKLSNLIAGGGIWMNTQRPEWNDANNAIVGYGLSVVTVCHLKRHLSLCISILKEYEGKSLEMTAEVKRWLLGVTKILEKYLPIIKNDMIDNEIRMKLLAELGHEFDAYKSAVYGSGFSGKEQCSYESVLGLLNTAMYYMDYTIKANKRSDGLYHSYNLIDLENGKIKHLKPMLEGQVAVLGCEFLKAKESADLLEDMEKSELYSDREKTYYLYPIIHTKPFMEKNIISDAAVNSSELFKRLLAKGDNSLIAMDCNENVRFNANISCAEKLKEVLDKMGESEEADFVLKCFEEQFLHTSFTGRSQIMYKYEGIGSVYWHQNSKLLVSVQERMIDAVKNNDSEQERLVDMYYRIRNGLGYNKTAREWGTFPTDAYSHTPYSGGAKQPGMTGQVKEEIITRFQELGIVIEDSTIGFFGSLIRDDEFLNEKTDFSYIDVSGKRKTLELPQNSLAFTFCQTPIVYEKSDRNEIEVIGSETKVFASNILPQDISEKIFRRTAEIELVKVYFS